MAAPYATDLLRALDADEIVPYFQPQVELRTGFLAGFEALARWRHSAHGSIAPDVFIPLAEDIGVISTLTRNLLHKVFVAAPVISGSEDISISFNISAIQFHDRSLPDQIYSAAEDTGFSLPRLVLEITESALIDNMDQALSIAQQLKTLGVRLALDDFGTGYSSLRHLQSLPFDELKVDASFIREMSDTRESRKIVAAVIGLGHSLSLTTVAEVVETKAQADMLLRLGCDRGQGWLYGPPIPSSDMPSFLSTRPLALPANPESSDDSLPGLEALPAQRLAQLQAIYDGAPVGLCFVDRHLRYISINQRLAEINGAPVVDHLGRLAQEMIPELFPALEPYLRRSLLGESFNDLEFSIPAPHPDGHPRTFLVSYQPVRDEADEVIGLSIAVIDITKRKLAEEALRESEALLRAIFDAVPVGILITDSPGGRILMSNPRAEAIFRRAMPVGESLDVYRLSNLFHADGSSFSPDEYPTVRAIRANSATDPEEILYRRGDGTQAWIRTTAAPVQGKNGTIVGAVLAIQDIQEMRLEKQELLDRVADLERQLKTKS